MSRLRTATPGLVLGLLTLASGCGSGAKTSSDGGVTIPEPTFTVDTTLTPHVTTVAGIDGGPARPVGSVAGPTGGQIDLVLGEVSVMSDDRAKVEALAARWGGAIVKEVGFDSLGSTSGLRLYLVAVDPSAADPSLLGADLQAIDPGARGDHRASTDDVLKLLTAAAQERVADSSLTIGVNFLFESQDVWSGSTADAANGPGDYGYQPDAFQWPYMKHHHVPEAWQALQAAGKLGNRVKILVLDGGFVQTPDFPASTTIYPADGWKRQNPATCTGDSPCPWHATEVTSAVVGQLDNGFGAAGTAGPVAELIAAPSPAADFFAYIDYFFNTLMPALAEGPRVINISATGKVPGALGFLVAPFNSVTTFIRGHEPVTGIRVGQGSLLFAAAGNTGEDVDHQDCFGFCWESDVFIPCEMDDVVCVGGLGWNSAVRDKDSNYGSQQRVHYRGFDDPNYQDSSVDFYGPWTVFVGPQPDDMGNVSGSDATAASGTSLATPFAAGVAALVWAADPTLTADDVFAILLQTSDSTGDNGLSINAEKAVAAALAHANNPPQIRIVAPQSGDSVGAGLPGVTFDAEVKDFEDGASCCAVSWSSNVEGAIGNGTTMLHAFQQPGTQIVTATVQDSGGLTGQASVSVTVTDPGPVVDIVTPASGDPIYRGIAVGLQGQAHGNLVDLCVAPTPSSWSTWTSDSAADAGSFPLHGCDTAVTFATNGTRTITFAAQDAYGTISSTTVIVTVADPPAGPVAEILQPPVNGTTNAGDVVHLGALVAGGQAPFDYRWTWQSFNAGCAEMTLTVTQPVSTPPPGPNTPNVYADWDTTGAQNVSGSCGIGYGTIRFYATDSHQQVASASEYYTIYYYVPPH